MMRPDWKPVADPPVFTREPYGWPMSDQVLIAMRDGGVKIATYEQADPDYPCDWHLCDADRWRITGRVTHWAPLPEGPQ